MLRSGTLVFPLVLALLAGCGAPPPPSSPDAPPAEAPAPGEEAAPADPSGEAAPASEAAPAEAAPQGAAPSEAEALARDFLKSGGRRVGYSASKKSFAYPFEQRREDGFRLDIVFTDEEGRRKDALEVCDFAACAEKLDEIAKDLLPKLAGRLEGDGYASIRGLGWPSGRDELEVGTLGMKLRYANGRLEALREGKPPASLGPIGAKKPELLAIFVIPDVKRLGVFAKPSGDAKGVVQEFHVVKLP
jgi:hypothetical protein